MENLEKEFTAYITLMSVINEIESMVTPIDIQTGLTTLARISTLLEKAKEISDKTQNLEFKEILTEIRNELVDTKNELIDSKEKNNKLKEENKKLKEEVDNSKPKPYYLHGLYYTTKEGIGGTGPYCTGCYDKNKDLIRLIRKPVSQLTCPICDTMYPRDLHEPFLAEDQSYEQTLQTKKECDERKRQNSN